MISLFYLGIFLSKEGRDWAPDHLLVICRVVGSRIICLSRIIWISLCCWSNCSGLLLLIWSMFGGRLRLFKCCVPHEILQDLRPIATSREVSFIVLAFRTCCIFSWVGGLLLHGYCCLGFTTRFNKDSFFIIPWCCIMRLVFFGIGALDCVLVVRVKQASEVRHIVNIFGSATTGTTFGLLKIKQALRGLVMLWTYQLADLESGGKWCILLDVNCRLLSFPTAVLVHCDVANRSILPKDSRCVHRFHHWSECVGLYDLIVIICHVCHWHTSTRPFRCLVFPLCILKLSFDFKLLKRLLLGVEFVFICQNLVILLYCIITLRSDSTRTFSSSANSCILAYFLGFCGKINAIRLYPILAVLIICI